MAAPSPLDWWSRRVSHGDRLKVAPVWSTFRKRYVYLSMIQHRVMLWVGTGRQVNQREAAAELGLSLATFNDSIRQLQRLGLVGHETKRGRNGFTRLWSNVRTTIRRVLNRALPARARSEHFAPTRPSVVMPTGPIPLARDGTGRWSYTGTVAT